MPPACIIHAPCAVGHVSQSSTEAHERGGGGPGRKAIARVSGRYKALEDEKTRLDVRSTTCGSTSVDNGVRHDTRVERW